MKKLSCQITCKEKKIFQGQLENTQEFSFALNESQQKWTKKNVFKRFIWMPMDCNPIWTKKSSKKLRLMAGDTGGVSLSTKKSTCTHAGILSKLIFSIQSFQQIDTNRIDIKLKKKKSGTKRGHAVST